MVAVGYMDPGNWATGILGGSCAGYTLLSVIFISNLIALIMQYCSAKLGIATRKDLARACRDYYSPTVATTLWILAEIAVIATDLAEVIGSAIALQLLFGIPILWGIAFTIADVLLLLFFSQHRARTLQAFITALIALIMGCFAIIVYIVNPAWSHVAAGLVPTTELITNPELLYIGMGIVGATVMPHNLYLHSNLVIPETEHETAKESLVRYATVDVVSALTLAFFVNAAILIVAAALFHTHGYYQVTEIQDAYHLFTPLLGSATASIVFAVALFISGQSSTITGTLAGQIIMEGFMNISLPGWLRRLISRCLTIIPALIAVAWWGESCIASLMLFSQIVLSLQLPFAIFPLLHFTNDAQKMGSLVNGTFVKISAALCACFITLLNGVLIFSLVS